MDGGPNIHGIKLAHSIDDLIGHWNKIGFDLGDSDRREFHLVCAGSSFSVLFVKTKMNNFQVAVNREVLCVLEKDQFIRAVYQSCMKTYRPYRTSMLDSDAVIEDIESALTIFKEKLCLA
ncbi:hypothetical protein [Paenibacillus sp. MMS18-CY102]|uniref:hypothetical protein n=1 Tax=Paenibacillus sp. MMS18-CY102 TaxID=2682849 RepID=UPI001366389B|nr:hypothetical protein [Paenibacillus sp. MMS18-CY102]MWC27337.1 hypothetical protein [Paenibacillus sp. MMS18-CY102]